MLRMFRSPPPRPDIIEPSSCSRCSPATLCPLLSPGYQGQVTLLTPHLPACTPPLRHMDGVGWGFEWLAQYLEKASSSASKCFQTVRIYWDTIIEGHKLSLLTIVWVDIVHSPHRQTSLTCLVSGPGQAAPLTFWSFDLLGFLLRCS